MATFISSGSETLLPSLHTQTSGPVELSTPQRSSEHNIRPQNDTLKLSVGAQVRQLVQQGQSTTQIGDALGLTAGLVDSYLYLPLDGASASPAPAASATIKSSL